MKYYLEEVESVLKQVNSSYKGLSNREAQKRQQEQGKNKLNEAKKQSLFSKIIKSILDPMIIMLLVTAGISAFTAKLQNEPYTDVFIILVVVIINTIMGLIQEAKAEKAIDSLKEMTASTSKVLRDGKVQVIKSEDIVVGDIIILEAGSLVPADARVIESHLLKVEEAALTGESNSVNKMINILNLTQGEKEIPLGDRKNMVYSGSTISYGRGQAVVTEIGMETQIGKIAKSLEEAEEETTPLQRKMGELSKTLTKIVIGISILVFVVSLLRHGNITGNLVIDTTLSAVALAVAAIPEGLPAVVTIILSIGVTAMAKKNALIRKLNAVETLGCVQVICSDKTGTLTKNKMTVVEEYTSDKNLLAKAMALCSDSKIEQNEEAAKGEPTENALVEYAKKLGLLKYELDKKFPRIGEVPFDSQRKLMSTICKEDGKIIQYTKGACEILVNKCTSYLQDGKVVPMTQQIKDEIIKNNKEYANKALRVLACSYKEHDAKPTKYEAEELENNLIFIGFVGMIDPCREEVFRCNTKVQRGEYTTNNDYRRPQRHSSCNSKKFRDNK